MFAVANKKQIKRKFLSVCFFYQDLAWHKI